MRDARGVRFFLAALLAATLLASLPTTLDAKAKHQTTDRRAAVNGVKGRPLPAMSALQRIEPPTRDVFLLDTAPDLDTACLFRNEKARLIIDIPIKKYVGPVDAQGYLTNPFPLVSAGVIPATADIIMAAHDIDFDGGPPAEHDVVWLNGQRLGLLTGEDNVTKFNSFTVDIRKIKFPQKPDPGQQPLTVHNRVEIEIDTASAQPNWCMSLDWVAIGMAIRPKIGWEISVVNGNLIQDKWASGREIKTIYKDTFDASCNVTTEIGKDVDRPKYPFSGPTGNNVLLQTTLKACPEGSMDTPTIRSEFSIEGRNAGGGRARKSFVHDANVEITEPIGAYNAELKFWLNGDDALTVTRKLFVTLTPVGTIPQFDNGPNGAPVIAFYEKATTWASGATNAGDALSRIRQGVFDFAGTEGWTYPAVTMCTREQSAELIADPPTCNDGICYHFSIVLAVLGHTAGVKGMKEAGVAVPGGLFMTRPGFPSLDPRYKGNIRRLSGGDFDRYMFSFHIMVEHNGVFQDPTFNGRYATDREFILAEQTGRAIDTSGNEYMTFSGGTSVYDLNTPTYAEWNTYAFESSTFQKARGKKLVTMSALLATALSLPVQAQFSVLDKDSDGIAEALVADVDVTVQEQGSYSVTGVLNKDNTVVAGRTAFQSDLSIARFTGGPGTHTVKLQFSGEEIRRAAQNGPYTLNLRVQGTGGPAVERSIVTPAYNYTDFAERAARILSVSEAPIDADGNGVFEGVELTTTLDVRKAGPFGVQGDLTSSSLATGLIGNAEKTIVLSPGQHQVKLLVPGTPIRRNGVDGRYDITITLGDLAKQRGLGTLGAVTRPYAAQDFGGAYEYAGAFADSAVDASGNGLYDGLHVEFAVNPFVLGPVLVRGRIEGSNGSTGTETLLPSVAQGSKVRLQFSGESISKQKLDGPYRVQVDFENPSTGKKIDGFYLPEVTAAYDHTQFDDTSDPGSITVRGLTDRVVDPDGDKLADQLIVTLSVQVGRTGTYEFSGKLVDARKTEIGFFTQRQRLVAGVNLVNLVFDARRIGAHGRDGPYRVAGLLMFGPNASLTLPDVGRTKAYAAKNFEGFVQRIEGDLNKDGKVDSRDLSLFQAAYGTAIGDPRYNPEADFDADMRITARDLSKMRALMARP